MKIKNLIILLICFSFITMPLADASSYDRYAPVYKETPQSPSLISKIFTDFLTYPFELIRWPLDKTLVAIEKYHLDKKVIWIYNQMKNHGVSPHLNVINVTDLSYGATFDWIRVAERKHLLPDVVLETTFKHAPGERVYTGVRAGMNRIGDSGFGSVVNFDYDIRFQEHFYGIGPNTSEGDGFVYQMETTRVGQDFTYEQGTAFQGTLRWEYKNVNISGGKDGGKGQFNEDIFTAPSVPGLHGDSLFSVSLEMKHDTRNQNENSTKGSLKRAKAGYHEGLGSSDARYFKYELEWTKYFQLGNPRRVFVAHAYGEHNDEVNGGIVPFHQMPRLGGHGTAPRLSHTLRGFDYNRFTDESAALINLEYRYTVWNYRYYKVDSVLFFDYGQVFDEISHFQWKDFRESYGVGFRLSAANIPLLSVEMAHGDEGTRFYVKSKVPF